MKAYLVLTYWGDDEPTIEGCFLSKHSAINYIYNNIYELGILPDTGDFRVKIAELKIKKQKVRRLPPDKLDSYLDNAGLEQEDYKWFKEQAKKTLREVEYV